MTALFFSNCSFASFNKRRNAYLMWTLFYQQKKGAGGENQTPKTDRKEDTRNTHGMVKRNGDIAQLQVSLPQI